MKALGGFISIHKNIKVVRIANNRFKEEGVQGIAYALQMKPAAPIELIGAVCFFTRFSEDYRYLLI